MTEFSPVTITLFTSTVLIVDISGFGSFISNIAGSSCRPTHVGCCAPGGSADQLTIAAGITAIARSAGDTIDLAAGNHEGWRQDVVLL
jgi:hypothetical protein